MLDPKYDTVDYGELLMPPSGFSLRRAIGTTYSLDLQALLAVPVALFYGRPLESSVEDGETPLDVFDAISRAASKVTVFCQRGKIKVPRQFNKLISLTESCVREVTPANAFSSFHPKCWWLWFDNAESGTTIIRCIVTSRNLTFDRSWDVSFSFDGIVGSNALPTNTPMVDMLRYLGDRTGQSIEAGLLEDLSRATFKPESPFSSWSFHPIGISGKYANPLTRPQYNPDTLLAMSPFVDAKTIAAVSRKVARKVWLFSRKTTLQELPKKSLEEIEESYCVNDLIVEAEMRGTQAENSSSADPAFLDLHGKLYISRNGGTNTWFLGSANLTDPAFGRNVECLIALKTSSWYYRPETVRKELLGTADNAGLFVPFRRLKSKADEAGVDIDQVLRKLSFDVSRIPILGQAVPDDEHAKYGYAISYDASDLVIPTGCAVSLRPWGTGALDDVGTSILGRRLNEMRFDWRLKDTQLSRYFVFTLAHREGATLSFVVKAEMELPESRERNILAEIVSSKERLFQYLRFLLTGAAFQEEGTGEVDGNRSSNSHNEYATWGAYSLPLYEELLRAASRRPEQLRRIDELFTRLKADASTSAIVSPELEELWSIFRQAIR